MAIALESLKFPVGYVLLADQIIQYQNEGLARDIFQYCGISDEQRQDPEGLINGLQFKKVIELLSEFLQKGEQESLYNLAEKLPLTGHGHLGLAMITADSLADAIALASAYIHQMVPAFEITLHNDGDNCLFRLTRVADFVEYNAVMDELAVIAFYSLMPFCGIKANQMKIMLGHREIVLLNLHPDFDGMQIQLNSGLCAVEFPTSQLNNKLTTASQVTNVMLVQKLEERERLLGSQNTLAYRLHELIKQALLARMTIELRVFAEQLNLPIRSLSRRLKEEGASYQHILNNCRMELAEKMLQETDTSIGQIAFSLGFNNESSFSRIFKQHKGLSPALYRKGL